MKPIIFIIAALTINVASGQSTTAQIDLAAMKTGNNIVFNSSGNAKSKGVDFTIKVPQTWSFKERWSPERSQVRADFSYGA